MEITEGGYLRFQRNGKRIRVHRDVMAKHLGRPLRSDEAVHHIDGDRTNNSLDNLQLMTWREHGWLHREPKDAETVARLRAEGYGYKRIAKHLGICVESARERVQRMEARQKAAA